MSVPRDWPEGVCFIKTELETGLLFCSIARGARDPEKAARNTANARKAYDTALRLLPRVILPSKESQQFDSAFAKLKGELIQLRESLS